MTAVLRVGLGFLAAVELVVGLWTLLGPSTFYAVVPTADVTTFSEHPFRDLGGATLGLALVLGAATVWTETRLIVVALVAFLAYAAPHLVFHLRHAGQSTGPADTAILIGLVGLVVLPSVLLVVALRRRRPVADDSTRSLSGRA